METYEVEVEDWGVIKIQAREPSEAAEKAVEREFSTDGFTTDVYSTKVRLAGTRKWQTFRVWGEPSITMHSTNRV